jgi:hypothetical protein
LYKKCIKHDEMFDLVGVIVDVFAFFVVPSCQKVLQVNINFYIGNGLI